MQQPTMNARTKRVVDLHWSHYKGMRVDQLEAPATGNLPRLLMITFGTLGWSTLADELNAFAERREDLASYHLRLSAPALMKWLNRGLPRLGLSHLVHPVRTWDWLLRFWMLRGGLPLDRFDVVYVAPITLLRAIARTGTRTFRLAASCDATAASWDWIMRGSPGGAYVPGSGRPDPAEAMFFRACDVITPWTPTIARAIELD
jgi:hypothetical protein